MPAFLIYSPNQAHDSARFKSKGNSNWQGRTSVVSDTYNFIYMPVHIVVARSCTLMEVFSCNGRAGFVDLQNEGRLQFRR